MRFTRLQLILLAIGIITLGSGIVMFLFTARAEFGIQANPILAESPKEDLSPITFTYEPITKIETPEPLPGSDIQASTSTETGAGDRINLNTSDPAELDKLPGIGAKTARTIVEYRKQHGPFTDINQLDAIKGIGKKTIEKCKDLVTIGPVNAERDAMDILPADEKTVETEPMETDSVDLEASAPDISSPEEFRSDKPADVRPKKPPRPSGKININTATAEELMSLPRVGPSTADKIIKDREKNGPFRSIDDLGRVPGIGPKTLDKMREMICTE